MELNKQTVSDTMGWPVIGDAVARRGNRFSKTLARTLLKIAGWRIIGPKVKTPKMMLIGAPHTSNFDFLLTIITMFALGVQLSWVAKHSAFKWPFNRLMTWLGGIGLDRANTEGFVGQAAAAFDSRSQLLLAIMPEGTRSKTKGWRTGFYYIAHQAQVPIFPIVFDYGRKQLRLGPEIETSGDLAADLPLIQSYFSDATGRVPNR